MSLTGKLSLPERLDFLDIDKIKTVLPAEAMLYQEVKKNAEPFLKCEIHRHRFTFHAAICSGCKVKCFVYSEPPDLR